MAKAIIKVSSNEGKYLLNEIRGLKEGTVISGKYDPSTGAFDFKHNGLDAVVWIGVNAELADKLVQDEELDNVYYINGNKVVLSVQLISSDDYIIDEFTSWEEAKEYAKANDFKCRVAYTADVVNGDNCNNIFWEADITKRTAISLIRKYLKVA